MLLLKLFLSVAFVGVAVVGGEGWFFGGGNVLVAIVLLFFVGVILFWFWF